VEADAYVWRYALLEVHARKRRKKKEDIKAVGYIHILLLYCTFVA